ncbi:MAG: SDR family NAD(P)-dependent oxidoreductase [Nocardioidaceae bacterium]
MSSRCRRCARNRSGTIVNVTSMGRQFHTPLAAPYHATLFAMSNCLCMEVQPRGLDVTIIEPGGIKAGSEPSRGQGSPSGGVSVTLEWDPNPARRRPLRRRLDR